MTATIVIAVSFCVALLVGALLWLTRSVSGYLRATFR